MLSLLLLHLLQRLVQMLILSPQLSQLRNELFWIHFLVRRHSRSLMSLLFLLTQASSSRPEFVQRSATNAAPVPRLQSMRATTTEVEGEGSPRGLIETNIYM